MKRVMCEMHCDEFTIGYGQTESTPVVTMSSPDDRVEVRVSTVGKALPCTEMKIVSPLDNSTMPAGELGEVCARGYMVMKGYDDDPEATARAVDQEGWLHTGDLGVMREDGYIHLTGRARDMIIRGGENVYPREVEEFLYTHPKSLRSRWWEFPMRDWANWCWRGYGRNPAQALPRKRSAAFVTARSLTSKFLSTSGSSMNSP